MTQATDRPRDPWFCLPVVACMLGDAAISLAFQPAAYWHDPAALREGNAAWAALMVRGPAVFLAAFLLYCLVIGTLLVWLRGALQKLLGMFVLLAHSYGSASWLHVELPDRVYWWGLIGLLLVEALAFAVYWRLSAACGAPCQTPPTHPPDAA